MVKKQWTKEDEIALINLLQDKYVDQLIELINSTKAEDAAMKQVNLTSPTGTGKTKMMAKLINKYPDAFFMVTTLSKGQLHKQVETSLSKNCLYDNYIVFGAMSLKINSILTEQNIIDLLPTDKDIYWIRDEGHINTNKWSKVLETRCKKIINFSATNKIGYGIVCNFTETMMLRTVNQEVGDIPDALDKLVEIKKAHKSVKNYNPCAIFKVTNNETEEDVIRMCKRRKLKPITLVDNNDYIMADICEDDNTYDVIINKQKIVEGIDIRRAHVIWMENKPNNPATTVQAIGRCRRNALLWRDDIDICDSKMKNLLQQTRKCFVFYNVEKAKLNVRDGEIIVDLCPIISIEKLHAGHTIYVEDGVMPNGLMVAELEGKTGFFIIETDDDTGFNIVNNPKFYHEEYGWHKNFLPGLDDLIEKLLDKNSEYFKNLVISTKPYIDGQPLWKYTVTSIGPTAKNQPMWHMCVIDGISIDGTLSVKNYTKTYDKDTLGCVIQPNSIDYGERNSLYSAFCTGENLINKTNNNTVCFDSKYHTMCDDIRPYRIFTLIDTYDMQHIIPIKILADLIARVQKDEQLDIAAVRSIFIDWYQHGALNDVVKRFDTAIYTNSLISILGMEDFEQHQSNGNAIWTPIKNVTSKITSNTKLTKYIEQKYKKEIAIAQTQCFPGHNDFDFQKIRNSCLGYCVEYYAKYLLFGDEWMEWELKRAQSDVASVNSGMYEVSPEELKQLIIVRACMIKYKRDVEYRFGAGAGQYVHSLSVKSLSHQDSRAFIDKVVELGTKACEFIKNKIDVSEAKNTQCDFITKHIIGAADFMDKNTIVDLKCTNHINNTMVKQVLAYHLLSQFRPDLDIKKVIVYDAVSGRFIEMDLTDIKE